MKRFKELIRIALNPLIAASVLTGIMATALAFAGKRIGLNAGEWSGWVQAVGSISAILITLGLTDHQIKLQQRGELDRSKEEARRICLAIRDELTFLQQLFTKGANVVALLNLEPGEIFDVTVPTVVPTERFSIYRSVVGRLTMIENDQLRQDIIWTYETAIGMSHAGLQNNRLLLDARDALRTDDTDRYEFHVEQLKASAAGMQFLCRETIKRVENLLPALDEAIGRTRGQ